MSVQAPINSPLGKETEYSPSYDPTLLYSIPRKLNREKIAVPEKLPFQGVDIWNAFELSWLNERGKPMIAIATFTIPCDSPNIIESKSLKLYLNSFNQSKFSTPTEVCRTLKKDLSNGFSGAVDVHLTMPHEFPSLSMEEFEGESIDDLDISISTYTLDSCLLSSNEEEIVSETLTSNLLKANCLVTGQPDWLSLSISYTGAKINRESLLRYIVSFRNCNEFTEQCIERIFMDLSKHCKPENLTVYGRCTRRGGVDINAFRSTHLSNPEKNPRLARQ